MSNIALIILLAIVVIFLNIGAFVIIIITLSSLGWWFFQPPKGTVVYKNKGEDLSEIWVNVGGHKLSGEEDTEGKRWIVKEKDEKKIEEARFKRVSLRYRWLQKSLWDKFGIRFISIFWPQVYINKFNVDRKRLVEGKDVSLKNRIVNSPNEGIEVDNLLFVSYRPVYKQGVELAGDNSKINLLLLPTWQLVNPTTPIYYYMGNFYPLLDSAVEAAVEDFFATHRVAVYRKGQEQKENLKDEGSGDDRQDQGEGDEGEFAHDEYNPIANQEGLTVEEYKKKYKPSPLTYSLWIKMKKAGNSPIEKHLISFNATRHYYNRIKKAAHMKNAKPGMMEILNQLDYLTHNKYKDEDEMAEETRKAKGESKEEEEKRKKLETKGLGEGIIPGIGYALIAFRLVEWEAHGDTQELARALQAKQTEKYRAAGVIEKAQGRRRATILEGQGESERYKNLISVQTQLGVHPDNASITLRETEKASKIGGENSKITHWFEKSGQSGGGHPPIAISDSQSSNSKNKEEDS